VVADVDRCTLGDKGGGFVFGEQLPVNGVNQFRQPSLIQGPVDGGGVFRRDYDGAATRGERAWCDPNNAHFVLWAAVVS